jgi:hypothetical protein
VFEGHCILVYLVQSLTIKLTEESVGAIGLES